MNAHTKRKASKGVPAPAGATPRAPAPIDRGNAFQRSYTIEPHDTWFFRESRPHAAIGGQELASLFPPPARSLWGMLAHVLGREAGVDWRNYRAYKRSEFGTYKASDLSDIERVHYAHGRLGLRNLALLVEGQCWFPAPAGLLRAANGDWLRLAPGRAAVSTDIGTVFVPEAGGNGAAGEVAMEAVWFNTEALLGFLSGNVPFVAQEWTPGKPTGNKKKLWVRQSSLFRVESRLGIGVDATNRRAKEAMLFQTGHLRPLSPVRWGIRLDASLNMEKQPTDNAVAGLAEGGFGAFGGEGRAAFIQAGPPGKSLLPAPDKPFTKDGRHHLLIYFATAADFSHYEQFVDERDQKHGAAGVRTSFERMGLPRSWTEGARDGARTWVLTLNGCSVELLCVAAPRPAREGGWSLSDEGPEAMRSLVPAGTCWYCVTTNAGAASLLHGKQIGENRQLGRGQIYIGTWKPHKQPN